MYINNNLAMNKSFMTIRTSELTGQFFETIVSRCIAKGLLVRDPQFEFLIDFLAAVYENNIGIKISKCINKLSDMFLFSGYQQTINNIMQEISNIRVTRRKPNWKSKITHVLYTINQTLNDIPPYAKRNNIICNTDMEKLQSIISDGFYNLESNINMLNQETLQFMNEDRKDNQISKSFFDVLKEGLLFSIMEICFIRPEELVYSVYGAVHTDHSRRGKSWNLGLTYEEKDRFLGDIASSTEYYFDGNIDNFSTDIKQFFRFQSLPFPSSVNDQNIDEYALHLFEIMTNKIKIRRRTAVSLHDVVNKSDINFKQSSASDTLAEVEITNQEERSNTLSSAIP